MAVALLAVAAPVQAKDWIQITLWKGEMLTLIDYGFYEGFGWERMDDFRVDRDKVTVVHRGEPLELLFQSIRMIENSKPRFTETFHDLAVDLVDGNSFRCEGTWKAIGVTGRSRVGEVWIPGSEIRSIEFLRADSGRRPAGESGE